MSAFVRDMLVTAGVVRRGTHDKSAVNLLRHSKISEFFVRNPVASAEERARLAAQFRHAPVTTEAYVRRLRVA